MLSFDPYQHMFDTSDRTIAPDAVVDLSATVGRLQEEFARFDGSDDAVETYERLLGDHDPHFDTVDGMSTHLARCIVATIATFVHRHPDEMGEVRLRNLQIPIGVVRRLLEELRVVPIRSVEMVADGPPWYVIDLGACRVLRSLILGRVIDEP